ncbi:probable Mitochondrial inner membrane protein OXA1 [Zygosaccharomyces bailii ISA1307]|nr:probable Mitochondrial inner membrane protein OXA1 [Zygosaccharomyces bailii ISA1307]
MLMDFDITVPKSLLTGPLLAFPRSGTIRFNSSDTIKSSSPEIRTELPSVDDLGSTSDIIDQTSQAIGEASNHIGYLHSIGLAKSWWWPADVVQQTLEFVHVYTGLPWWGTICVVTIAVRILMFPIYVKSSDTVARNSHIKPQMDKLNAQLMSTTDLSEGQKVAMKRKKLLAEHGIKNRWMAAPMLQIPVALGFFAGIRHMANFPVDGFTNQGIAWFTDLSQADPYLGLQVITAAVLIGFSRLGGETGAQQWSPVMKKVFTIIPLLSIPATMNVSAAVALYFAVNGTCAVIQTLTLRNKWVRQKLNIAEICRHPQTENGPQKSIIETFRENMAKSREQAEHRQRMKEKDMEEQERVKDLRKNQHIKIVRKSDLRKNLQK